MIATLRYIDAETGDQAATLEDDLTWHGSDPEMVRSLNASLAAEDRSPAAGDWLLRHAHRMADLLDASIEAEEKPAPPPGRVY